MKVRLKVGQIWEYSSSLRSAAIVTKLQDDVVYFYDLDRGHEFGEGITTEEKFRKGYPTLRYV